LLIPLPPCFGKIADPDHDSSDADDDADEEQAYLEECTGLLSDLSLADDGNILQIH
jgi:hypothetical protein